MRAVTAMVVAGVLLACGGSSSSSSNTGTSVALTGSSNVSGTLNEATSIVLNGKSCRAGNVNLSASAAFIGFSTLSNACQLLQQQQDPANATLAGVALARVAAGSSVPLATGTYTFFDTSSGGIPPFDPVTLTASLVVAGTAVRNGGSAGAGQGCTIVEQAKVTGGTVTLSSVTPTAVVGTLNLTLSNGGKITGNFEAPVCPTNADITATCTVTGIPVNGTGTCM